jgi:glycosyltransferase 2 family protein
MTSTSMRSTVWRVAQVVAIIAAFSFAAATLRQQWGALSVAQDQLDLHAGYLVLASLCTLVTYAALVHAWRLLTGGAGQLLPFGTAARIWSIANLGRYIPGKVWSVVALGVMARDAGVSGVVASTAAIAGTLLNIGLGFAVVGILGAPALDAMHFSGGRTVAGAVALLTVLGLVASPWLLPRVVRWIQARRGAAGGPTVELPPARLAVVAAINMSSWCAYGLAFHWMCLGIGVPGGVIPTMIAVFSASYLAGYLALPLPGGLVVREAALVAALTGLGVMGSADATLTAVSSRLWLTMLEIVPGCVALALRPREARGVLRQR